MSNEDLIPAGAAEGTVFRRVAWRLMPFLFICLVFNWLDRVAVSFAHLQFGADLHISDTAFGLSVGLFQPVICCAKFRAIWSWSGGGHAEPSPVS